MRVEPQQLRAFLLDANLVTAAQFDAAFKKAKKTGRDVGQVLVDSKLLSKDQLAQMQAYILGIPYVDLETQKINPEVLKIIPESIAKTYNIVAFRKTGNNLEVAMLDPQDLHVIDFIKKRIGLRILPRLTSEASLKKALQQYRKTLKAEFGELIKGEKELKVVTKREELPEKEDLAKAAEELPIIKIVDTLIRHAILERASDIHIEPTEKEVRTRYRIDGILRDAMMLPKQVHDGIVARIKVLANLKLDEHRLPQDGRFKVEGEDYKYSLRVSVLPVVDGEKIVMRLLPETAKAMSLEQLGLWGEALKRVNHNLKKPVGMILVTGPTGSGKTTTLYSIIDILNTSEVNISTIEDPVEYRMPGVNQTQVNPKVGLTFANGLRALVRQDPDIIMVGEIRDEETASLAINAALTGHMVLSTLHTTNAAGAIPRMIDMKVKPFLLSSTLNLVIAQRLVRRLCETKEEYKLTKTQLEGLSEWCDMDRLLNILKKEKIVDPNATWKDVSFWRPKPSKACPDGYRGRIGIYECLSVTDSIKELIMKGASSDEISQRAQSEGMLTMVEDGLIKAAKGITTIEEVLRVISE